MLACKKQTMGTKKAIWNIVCNCSWSCDSINCYGSCSSWYRFGIFPSDLIFSYTGIGVIMVGAGLIFGLKPLLVKKVHHHDHAEKETQSINKLRGGIGYFVVLGAALSPDPTIIPIYLSAISAGFYFALELSAVFAAASIFTLLLLVQLGTMGL